MRTKRLRRGAQTTSPELIDDVRSATYEGGYVTGYSQSGSLTAPASPVGATSFDFLVADEATRQASYDYPYYGISSPDPSVVLMSVGMADRSASSGNVSPASSSLDTLRQFVRHGLTRRGVRAMIDAATEIGRSAEGYRRFRAVRGDETIVLGIDPITQLLMREESAGPADTMVADHPWTRVPVGFVRKQTKFEVVEVVGGKKMRSRGSLAFQKVRIVDPNFRILVGPDASP